MDDNTSHRTRSASSGRRLSVRVCIWLTVAVNVVLGIPRYAVAGHFCPRCSAHCELSVDEGEQSRHCWKVEWEQVCVPKVVFPWQNHRLFKHPRSGCSGAGCSAVACSSCTAGDCGCQVKHNGAFVIKVRKLKKHKYTCPKCEYSWEVKKPGCTEACTALFEEAGEETSEDDAADEDGADEDAAGEDMADDELADDPTSSDEGTDGGPTKEVAPEDYMPETPPEPEALPPTGPSLGSPRSTAARMPAWEPGVHRYRQLQERPIVFEITDLP